MAWVEDSAGWDYSQGSEWSHEVAGGFTLRTISIIS